MLFSIILLLVVIRPSYEVIYSCNTTVSCGCSAKPVSITRIVGGESASAATWNWAVSISINDRYLCGGSIISSSWILTAAHCVNGYIASQIKIYAGSILLRTGTQSRVSSQIIMHPFYEPVTYVNDIALLRLSSPLSMNDSSIGVICIPSVTSATLSAGEWPPVGTTVVAIGWGSLIESGSSSSILQQVTLSTIDHRASTCRPWVSDAKVQFCAGVSRGGKDTCQGDSGGPLMMFTSTKQWILVGLTSFGDGCAKPTSSGVYTRVAAYENWIKSNIGDSYSSVPFSYANTIQTSIRLMILLVVLFVIIF